MTSNTSKPEDLRETRSSKEFTRMVATKNTPYFVPFCAGRGQLHVIRMGFFPELDDFYSANTLKASEFNARPWRIARPDVGEVEIWRSRMKLKCSQAIPITQPKKSDHPVG